MQLTSIKANRNLKIYSNNHINNEKAFKKLTQLIKTKHSSKQIFHFHHFALKSFIYKSY